MIDEEEDRIEVVVPDDQLSLAIGRRGQNVRLASQLTGKAIDILTEADASEKRQKEFVERTEMFQNELDVDETLAQLLVAEGFGALEEVAYVERRRDRRDRRLRRGSRRRAAEPRAPKRSSAARRPIARSAARSASRTIWPTMPYLTEAMLVTLGKAGIKTLDDLADLATDELVQKKRQEPRRRNEDAPKRPEDKGGVLGRIWPERRAGQRDHHGRPRALVRGRGTAADAADTGEDAMLRNPPNETLLRRLRASDSAAARGGAGWPAADAAMSRLCAGGADPRVHPSATCRAAG